MTGVRAPEIEEKIQKIREICADSRFSAERMLIEIKRTIDPHRLDEQDHIYLGKAFQKAGFYQEAVNEFWEAWSLLTPGLDCLELIISILEQMTPDPEDLHHLATTLKIAINKSCEMNKQDQELLTKLVDRYNALNEKHGLKV